MAYQYKWNYISAKPEQVHTLQKDLGIHPLLCQLLVQRGITTFSEAKDFFRPSLSHLHDPFLMQDMHLAITRIEHAIKNGERILIYGDYDVDGTTAVSLVSSFLQQHYSNIDTYIPDRYKEGYGVSTAGIDYANDNDITLIIALDCGIKAIDKVAYAKTLGIDFIICDHHLPGDDIPAAIAVLDPKRKDCNYPYKELSGCGIGFKLVQALCEKWNLPNTAWEPLLDLTAVSIGADIVPITGENRVLAFYGLQRINQRPRPGFKLLASLAGKQNKVMSITDVVFLIGPRINAAGRMAHGRHAVELLTSVDLPLLEKLSQEINEMNSERKDLDSQITQDALTLIKDQQEEDNYTTVVFNEKWHKGVIGIVASRLIENYYRPTIVFTQSGDHLAGSARSVKGFDVYKALDACSDILTQFGGHMYAAGMTLDKAKFPAFKERFEEVVQSTIPENCKQPVIEIDLVCTLDELDQKFYRILKQFAPYGPQNMPPNLATHHLIDTGFSKIVGQTQEHLRVVVKDPESGKAMNGIAFGLADKLSLLQSGEPISLVYHLEENVFNGETSLQMHIKDIRFTKDVA